ncbi:MAG TPA: glycosyltransferase [bacterium]|nr:glycosyltransferase [bacterium]
MAERIRVTWLIKGLGLGGAEHLLLLAARHVDRTRFAYEVVFLLPWKSALVQDLEEQGIPTLCLNQKTPYDLRVIARLSRHLRGRRTDLLHSHLPYTGVIGRVAGRLAGVAASIYTEHNLQERYHWVTRAANQLTMPLSDAVVAVSDEVRGSLARRPIARHARMVTIRNGVDAAGLRQAAAGGAGVREEFGIPLDAPLIGVVNVFRPQKRLDLWISAAQLISAAEPRAHFMIVGDGPSAEALRRQAEEKGLAGRIHFPGLRRDAPRLIASFDVFMLSSVYEGLPVAALEAMALGRPVVATRVGGLPGLIVEGRHGYLVTPGDPGALAERVLHLLRQPELRRRVGTASAQRVADQFGIETMVRATESLYEAVLAGKRRIGARAQEARA